MSNIQKLKKSATTFVLLLFIWVIYLLFIFINGEKLNDNLQFIPKDATFVCRIDAREIISKSTQQILLQDKNEQLLKTIKDLLDQPNRKKSSDVGIDMFSDVVAFVLPYKDGKLLGISFNLVHPAFFKKNISEFLSKNQTYYMNENVGIVFQYFPNNSNISTPISQIQKYLNSNLEFQVFNRNEIENKSIFELNINRAFFDPTTSIHSAKLSGSLKDNSFEFEGEINLRNKIDTRSTFLKPTNSSFHFSSLYTPQSVKDSLKNMLQRSNIEFPEIKSISMNYSGLEFGNLNNEMVVIPDIDLLITTKSAFSIDLYLKENLSTIHDEIIYKNNELIIGEYVYSVKQLDQFTFYIGKSKKPEIQYGNDLPLLVISGDLGNFIKIKGGGFMMSILEMYPLYKSSKTLINSTKNINLTFSKSKTKKVNIKGEINFKQNHFVASEFLLFILSSGLLE